MSRGWPLVSAAAACAVGVYVLSDLNDDPEGGVFSAFDVTLTLVYMLPCIIAGLRGHPDWGMIFIKNLLLGWTGIGWLAALRQALGG